MVKINIIQHLIVPIMCLFVMRIFQINLMNFNCNFHVVYYLSRVYWPYNQNFTLIKQHFAIPQHHQVTINLLILSYQEIVLSIFQVFWAPADPPLSSLSQLVTSPPESHKLPISSAILTLSLPTYPSRDT